MCPEGSKIKINKKIITAIIITAIVLLTVFVIVRYAVLRPVPELQRLKGLEVNRYDVACYAYDGDKYSYMHLRSLLLSSKAKSMSMVRRLYGATAI